jgi:hypothetical protein
MLELSKPKSLMIINCAASSKVEGERRSDDDERCGR